MAITPVNQNNSTNLVSPTTLNNNYPIIPKGQNIAQDTFEKKSSSKKKIIIIAGSLVSAVALGVIFRKKIANIFRSGKEALSDSTASIDEQLNKLTPDKDINVDDFKLPEIEFEPEIKTQGKSKTKTPVEQTSPQKTQQTPPKQNLTEEIIDPDGKKFVIQRYPEKSLIVTSSYQKDGKTIEMITEKDTKTNQYIKSTLFDETGKHKVMVQEYEGGKQKTKTLYKENSDEISSIQHLDPETGNITKMTIFKENEINEFEFDKITGKTSKLTFIDRDPKTVKSIYIYSPKNGALQEIKSYQPDGKTLQKVDNFNPETGKKISTCEYKDDGKTIDNITEFNEDGKMNKLIAYFENGKVIREIEPETGLPKKDIFYDKGEKNIIRVKDY